MAEENDQKERRLTEINDLGSRTEDSLKTRHDSQVTKLTKEISTFKEQLTNLRGANKLQEDKMRQEFLKFERQYIDKLDEYDKDMEDHSRDKHKVQAEFDEVHNELLQIQDEYKQRLEEKKKRDEEFKRMEAKRHNQQKELDLLNRSAEWMQAHWKGLITRREMEKARKGKKKKKKKK